jgi:hypothetical protein
MKKSQLELTYQTRSMNHDIQIISRKSNKKIMKPN